jgi:hypothetical protein
MSVSHTVDAVVSRRKTVTRRKGWVFLKPGERVTLCRKVMGRRPGEPLERLCDVEILSVRRELLTDITDDDVTREGFVALNAAWFVEFFCEAMGGRPDQEVTRIEWRYLDEEPT